MKKPIQSIKKELAACRKAFQENPEAKYAWCCHHSILIELLTEPYENRIKYILSDKPKKEQAVRFRNFRPVRIQLPEKLTKASAEWAKASAEYDKAYTEYDKAVAEYDKAYAEWNKALTEYAKASAKLTKVYAALDEARAERDKAYAKFDKANAEYRKAYAKFDKASAELNESNAMFSSDWDNTWNGQDIF